MLFGDCPLSSAVHWVGIVQTQYEGSLPSSVHPHFKVLNLVSETFLVGLLCVTPVMILGLLGYSPGAKLTHTGAQGFHSRNKYEGNMVQRLPNFFGWGFRELGTILNGKISFWHIRFIYIIAPLPVIAPGWAIPAAFEHSGDCFTLMHLYHRASPSVEGFWIQKYCDLMKMVINCKHTWFSDSIPPNDVW